MKPRLLPSLALVFTLAAAGSLAAPADKPNIILILADDLGWTDLGGFGSDLHETPALDQLARDGMKFTQNYSACTVCSPTRAALLTGKYPARLRITDWIPGLMPDNPKLLVPDWTKFLPHSETTLAEVFKAHGYATASIGKWHLGTEDYWPTTHGFDLNIAGTDKPAPSSYHAPWRIPTLTPERNPGDYLTDRIGAEAVKFIERAKDRETRILAASHPEKTRELRDRLHAWRKDVGAQMPSPNPRYDASRPEYTPPPAKQKKGYG